MQTIETGHRDYLLFDGDCGICTYSSGIARRMDRNGDFMIEPYQIFPESELEKFGLGHRDCSKKLQVITRRGRVYGGAFGVNYFLWRRFPWSLLVILIYAFPLLLVLELIGYRLVADHRLRLSRWLGMKACLVKR